MKQELSKTFDLGTLRTLKQAERFKTSLENRGYSVETQPIGLNGVRITGRCCDGKTFHASNPRRKDDDEQATI